MAYRQPWHLNVYKTGSLWYWDYVEIGNGPVRSHGGAAASQPQALADGFESMRRAWGPRSRAWARQAR